VGPGDRIKARSITFSSAHVAGPGVARERVHDGFWHFLDPTAELGLTSLDDGPHQEGDVFAPVPEGRDVDGEDSEPVEEIFAEAALREGPGQVAIRGGEDPDVDLHGARAADALELTVLEDAKKLRLEVQGELADLVQEERPAVGELEAAHAGGGRAREGALLVAEQLALDEGGRQGGTVDADQRARTPGAPVVDRPGQELLPRARLPKEQHRGVHRRHLRDPSQDMPDGQAPPHDVVETVRAVDLFAEVDVLGFEVRLKLADLGEARPQLGFRSLPVEGVREDLPQRPHAGHRDVRPRPRRLEGARPEGADEAAPDGDREDQDGLDAGPSHVLALPAGLEGQVIWQSLDPEGLAEEESVVDPWHICLQEGVRVGLDRRTRPRVGGTEARAVGGELREGRVVRAEALDELAQGALDLRVDPLGLDPGEAGGELGEERLELACGLWQLAHAARPV
jgi:hypothetical protein